MLTDPPTGVARDGGTVAGVVCLLEVASSDGAFGASTSAVPDEEIVVYGEGWAANAEVDLRAENTQLGAVQHFTVQVDGSGVLVEAFAAERGAYGSWTFTVTQVSPSACESAVMVEVLPLADVLESKFLHDIKWLFLERITTGCGGDLFCPDGRVTRGQMATFLSRALNLPATSTDYFTDDSTNKHQANINRLRAAGITYGCSATKFCPDGLVTRGQMASFLSRAYRLPSTSTDYFTDDSTNKHQANINRLRAAGITSGCSATKFCPDGLVTRGQMASFLARAYRLSSTSTDYFTDDSTNKHQANINRLRAAGITSGCSATTYCPDGLVTRGQMAAFIHRAEK